MKENTSKITLLKNSEWCLIEGELCRVIDFVPMGLIRNREVIALDKATPYASIHLECKKFLDKEITGFVTHKLDFIHLWAAFKERGVKSDEEVIISWYSKHEKGLFRFFSFALPKLCVMICHKEAFELMTNPNYRPELRGEARFKAEKPIIEWKPE